MRTPQPGSHRSPDEARGLLAGIAAYLVWGLLTIYWHRLSGLSAFELIGVRIVGASLLLVVSLAATRRLGELAPVLRSPALLARVGLAAALLSINWTAYVWAVTHDNVVETALGYFLAPLGTVAVGILAFGERLRRAQGVAVALASASVLILTFGYGEVPVLALLIAATWAGYGWLKRLVPLTAVPSLAAETLVLLPLAVILVVVHEADGNGIFATAPGTTRGLVLLAGAVTVVPLLLFTVAAQRVRFTVLGPLQYTVPVINFVLGVTVFGEQVPGWRAVGFLLVVAALVVSTIDALRQAAVARSVASHSAGSDLPTMTALPTDPADRAGPPP